MYGICTLLSCSFIKERYFTRRTKQFEEDEILMPIFIDLKVLENSNETWNQEFLRILFEGRLEDGESLIDVKRHYDEFNIKWLREKYGQRKAYLKIDCIICVCSGDRTVPLPDELVKCLNAAARSTKGSISCFFSSP